MKRIRFVLRKEVKRDLDAARRQPLYYWQNASHEEPPHKTSRWDIVVCSPHPRHRRDDHGFHGCYACSHLRKADRLSGLSATGGICLCRTVCKPAGRYDLQRRYCLYNQRLEGRNLQEHCGRGTSRELLLCSKHSEQEPDQVAGSATGHPLAQPRV